MRTSAASGGGQQIISNQPTRAEQPATRPGPAVVLQTTRTEPIRAEQATRTEQASGDHAADPVMAADPSPTESPKPKSETRIAEQRVSADHRPTQQTPAKLTTPPAAEKPAKPSSRLSNYQAEAAKLLAGAMTGRRKRRAVPEVTVADPVAEDQAGQASRPAKKGKKD